MDEVLEFGWEYVGKPVIGAAVVGGVWKGGSWVYNRLFGEPEPTMKEISAEVKKAVTEGFAEATSPLSKSVESLADVIGKLQTALPKAA